MGRKPNPNKVEKKAKNPKTFIEDPSLITLANKVITDNKLDYLNQVKIKYVLVDTYISKTCIGKCIRASKELKHFGNLDYIIELSNDIWRTIDDKTREIILLHELLHILYKDDGINYHVVTNKDGELKTKILDHDIQDFGLIIKQQGIDWIKEIKNITTSVRDMDVSQMDNIKV